MTTAVHLAELRKGDLVFVEEFGGPGRPARQRVGWFYGRTKDGRMMINTWRYYESGAWVYGGPMFCPPADECEIVRLKGV